MPKKLNSTALRTARQARKLSVAEVSNFTKIAANRITRFESGDASPSISQMTKFGDLYNVPFFEFFSDRKIELDNVLPDFRKTNPVEADLSPRGLTKIWQVEKRINFVQAVIEALGQSAPKTKKFKRLTNKNVVDAATLRSRFDDWLDRRPSTLRFQGSREDIFSKQLRLYLEVHGCHTSINSAPIDDYLGFYINQNDVANVIFVNRDVRNEKRRLFTLAHELAHLAYNEEGVSNPFIAKNLVERQCNAFAAEFLAPEDAILSLVERFQGRIRENETRLVDHISSSTLLSRQASTLRLRDLDIISKSTASVILKRLSSLRRLDEPRADKPTDVIRGRNVVVATKLAQVGVYAAYTSSLALNAKLIDRIDISRGLGISETIQADVLNLATRRFEASAA